MNAADTIIRVEKLYAGYDGVAIQENVNFEVRRGEVFGILALRLRQEHAAEAHDRPQRADLGPRLHRRDDIVTADEQQRAAILRRFGVMYQSGALFGSMTLLENVRLPIEEYTDLPDDAIDLIAAMKPRAGRPRGLQPATCRPSSPAACRSVRIARAMALTASILFMDEPSSASTPSPPRRRYDATIRRLSTTWASPS